MKSFRKKNKAGCAIVPESRKGHIDKDANQGSIEYALAEGKIPNRKARRTIKAWKREAERK